MKWCALVFALLVSLNLWAYTDVTVSDQSPDEVFLSASPLPDLNPPSGASLDQQWTQFLNSTSTKELVADDYDVDFAKLEIDWNGLWALNQQAEAAWNALLDCAGGNPVQARNVYLDLSNCPTGAQKIKALHFAIKSFTASSSFAPMDLSKAVKCHGSNPCFSYSLDKIHNVLRALPLPPMHPLLTQMLFEQASTGFPFMWAEHNCLLWTCIFDRDKEIRESPLFGFLHSSSHSEGTRKRFVNDLINLFTKNNLRPDEMANEQLRDLRSSYVALRTLDILSMGRRSCTEFGLWPQATGRLIVAMGSWNGNKLEFVLALKYIPGFESFPNDLHDGMSASCEGTPKALFWVTAFAWGISHNPNLDYAWDSLAKAGAWRALNERNDEL